MSSTSTIGALGKVIKTAVAGCWLYPVLTLLALKLKKDTHNFRTILDPSDMY